MEDLQMAALILNQSNESCCCSDDEFTVKVNPKSPRSSNKNLRQLQNPGLQHSIENNQLKHQKNEAAFKIDLQSQKFQLDENDNQKDQSDN
jgi:hypothetical protein